MNISEYELNAALSTYNKVWEDATNITAKNVAFITKEAMRKAIEVAFEIHAENDAVSEMIANRNHL